MRVGTSPRTRLERPCVTRLFAGDWIEGNRFQWASSTGLDRCLPHEDGRTAPKHSFRTKYLDARYPDPGCHGRTTDPWSQIDRSNHSINFLRSYRRILHHRGTGTCPHDPPNPATIGRFRAKYPACLRTPGISENRRANAVMAPARVIRSCCLTLAILGFQKRPPAPIWITGTPAHRWQPAGFIGRRCSRRGVTGTGSNTCATNHAR